ncbi:universal stress protein [Halalkalibacterium halodurans]|uniref:Universal stress protein n=1 Tax=Halalkalibacterium halodurans TaxID=86665 RepID=A0A0M0KDJ7_ALKHA|nr:universal stress protein [Halalkalibacterium halodurans]MED3645739.1 universal stress protein [Halalkalibacterium halodurans]MED4162452.1 universal stress protein [Halalkalibacterium halodurans]TES44759.1 universal stress protein [Halalkalibacterium halodurans]TPE67530.1 universal stress protein [Halalkalibacterium halodurans]
MMKKILLATDGSVQSQRSAEQAIQLATAFNGVIDVVHVIDAERAKHDALKNITPAALEQDRKQRLNPVLTNIKKEGIPYKLHFLKGEPGPSIVDFANKGEYDWVILGSRGLNPLQTMVLGSVSHKVAKRVKWPVMIVK